MALSQERRSLEGCSDQLASLTDLSIPEVEHVAGHPQNFAEHCRSSESLKSLEEPRGMEIGSRIGK